jgi:thioesterase domain-containing protein
MELCEALQVRAFKAWIKSGLKPCLPVRAILFRSNESRPEAPTDLGWSGLVERLDIIAIDGDHHGMLRAPYRKNLCVRFQEAMLGREHAENALTGAESKQVLPQTSP